MKKITLIIALTATILFTGCATTRTLPDGSVVREHRNIAPAVKTAAYIGTFYALKEHPEWRDGFELAATELAALEMADTLDIASLVAIVHRLPVDELKSAEASVIIAGATILLSEYGGDVIPLDRIKELQPIARALREGIELGLQ